MGRFFTAAVLVLGALFSFSERPACAEGPELYFGLLHAHTSYSDGSGMPDDAFEMAKEVGLDFMAITDHNHYLTSSRPVAASTVKRPATWKEKWGTHRESNETLALVG